MPLRSLRGFLLYRFHGQRVSNTARCFTCRWQARLKKAEVIEALKNPLSKVAGEVGQRSAVEHVRDAMWRKEWMKKDPRGQNLIEYAIVAAIVSAAVVAMSTYVFRSVQATQQSIDKEFRNE